MTKIKKQPEDILLIHSRIIENFENVNNKIKKYKENLEDLNRIYKNTIDEDMRQNLRENIKMLKDKIEYFNEKNDKNYYIIETAELINKYKKILNTPIKTNFMGKKNTDNKEKNEIISKYKDIAKKYTTIYYDESKNISKNVMKCKNPNCKNIDKFEFLQDNIYVCLECATQQELHMYTSSYKDIDRVNIVAKYTYDRKVHFKDCIKQYQGGILFTIFFPTFYIFCTFTKNITLIIPPYNPFNIYNNNLNTKHLNKITIMNKIIKDLYIPISLNYKSHNITLYTSPYLNYFYININSLFDNHNLTSDKWKRRKKY